MNILYVSCKISAICWLNNNNSLINESNESSSSSHWLCGTYSSNVGTKNFLTIFAKEDEISNDPQQQQQQSSNIVQLKNFRHYFNGDVMKIINYNYNESFFSLSNGQISLIQYNNMDGFNIIFDLLNNDLFEHQTNDILLNNNFNELISCGNDGHLLIIDINNKKIKMKSNLLTKNSLYCLDKLSDYEFICGTTSGNIKLYDKRLNNQQQQLTISTNELSIIKTIKCNLHNNYIIACGNDLGCLTLWDIRNISNDNRCKPLIPPISNVHDCEINQLKFIPNEQNKLITSGLDGKLIKWNILNNFEIDSCEAIIDKKNIYPINCFDLNQFNNNDNRIIFSDDNEVLYLTKY